MAALGHPGVAWTIARFVDDPRYDGNSVLVSRLSDRLAAAAPSDDAALFTPVLLHDASRAS